MAKHQLMKHLREWGSVLARRWGLRSEIVLETMLDIHLASIHHLIERKTMAVRECLKRLDSPPLRSLPFEEGNLVGPFSIGSIGDGVGLMVGLKVGLNVGARVGLIVGFRVGYLSFFQASPFQTGDLDGDVVGLIVGDRVCGSIGIAGAFVGDSVGLNVGENVGLSVRWPSSPQRGGFKGLRVG